MNRSETERKERDSEVPSRSARIALVATCRWVVSATTRATVTSSALAVAGRPTRSWNAATAALTCGADPPADRGVP